MIKRGSEFMKWLRAPIQFSATEEMINSVIRTYNRYFNPPVFAPDGHSIAQCAECRRHLNNHTGVRLQRHLNEEHRLDLNASIATMKWLMVRVDKYRGDIKGMK